MRFDTLSESMGPWPSTASARRTATRPSLFPRRTDDLTEAAVEACRLQPDDLHARPEGEGVTDTVLVVRHLQTRGCSVGERRDMSAVHAPSTLNPTFFQKIVVVEETVHWRHSDVTCDMVLGVR